MKKWIWWVLILGGAAAAYFMFFKPKPNGNEAERSAQQRLARARARHS